MDATKEAILAQLLGTDSLEDDVSETRSEGPSGVGRWPDAVLEEVIDKPKNEYGYSVELRFDLNGIGGGKPFKTFLNLASASDTNEKRVMAQTNNLASLMHAGEVLPAGKRYPAIDSQERYDKLIAILRASIGSTFPLDIKPRSDKPQFTNVWGLKRR